MSEHHSSSLEEALSELEASGKQIKSTLRSQQNLSVKELSLQVAKIMHGINHVDEQAHIMLDQLHGLQNVIQKSARITSSLELEQVLQEIVDSVVGLTGAERAYLMLRDEEDSELNIRIARNWDQETIGEEAIAFSYSIVKTAIKEQSTIVTIDAQIDNRFSMQESVAQSNLRSVVCIPLLLQAQIVGVLYADNRIEKGLFTQEMIPVLTAFGTQAAIAIKNASEFAQVKDDLKEARQKVVELKVQIDRKRVKEEIDAVTGSEYFDKLADIAKQRRESRQVNPTTLNNE